MFNKKNMIITTLIVACIIIVIPLIIDWLIIGNNVPSNIANSDWVSFLGGYIGAILGGIGSLIGIILTIRFTAEQNRRDRELQIRPYFDIRCEYTDSFTFTKNWLGYIVLDTWEKEDEKNKQNEVCSFLICLKNVGNGPATNLSFKMEMNTEGIQYSSKFTTKNLKVTTSSVSQNSQAEVSVEILNRKQAPLKEDCRWEDFDGMSFCHYDNSKYSFPSRFSFSLDMMYNDLLGNRFLQKMQFDAYFEMSVKKDEDCSFRCETDLKEISPPVMIKSAQ